VKQAQSFGWLMAVSLPAAACDCAGPVDAFRSARTIVIARVVHLELPSLNPGLPDSPARSDIVRGRAVVTEVVRGEWVAVVPFEVIDGGMCGARPPRLGESLVIPIDTPKGMFEIGPCSPLLSFGEDWQGWDEETLGLRDVLRTPSDIDSSRFSDEVYRHFRWAIPPPAPPSGD
jgi:hypothetical protein